MNLFDLQLEDLVGKTFTNAFVKNEKLILVDQNDQIFVLIPTGFDNEEKEIFPQNKDWECSFSFIHGLDLFKGGTLNKVKLIPADPLKRLIEKDSVIDTWYHKFFLNNGDCLIGLKLVHNGGYDGFLNVYSENI